jgi:hypothetical protein
LFLRLDSPFYISNQLSDAVTLISSKDQFLFHVFAEN